MPSPRKKPTPETAAPKRTAKGKAAAPADTTAVRKATPRRKVAAVTPDGDAPPPAAGGRKFDLVIVESPAKAKTINKYLGGSYKVLASYGHVRDLATGRRQAGEEVSGIKIGDGWKLRYLVDAGSKSKKRKGRRTQRDILDELKAAADKANRVLLASDPDREGESIAWHIADELQLDPARTRRIRFNEITKNAVQQALAQADHIDMDRVKAQEARRAMDRVVGFPLSGLLGNKVTRGLSAGRVQSVAVKLIVDREREIEAFKTEEYWELTALLAPQGGGVRWVADPKKSKIFAKKKPGEAKPEDEAKADDQPVAEGDAVAAPAEKGGIPAPPPGSFLAKLAKVDGADPVLKTEADADRIAAAVTGVPYVISKIEQKDQQQRPRPPFTTSTLQQEANVRLRFAASRTMQTAQRLYEGVDLGSEGTVALITYMRTDSTRISPDALTAIRGHIQHGYGDRYLPEKPNFYAAGKSAQEAHECIRPTDVAMTPDRAARAGLAGDQLRLYTLIWQRTVASQMTPAVFAVTTVDVTAGPGLFRASGRIEKFDGFRKVLPTKAEDVELPKLAEKQTLDRLDLFETQHFTQPPPRYNEGSLVKMMEKEGIGRPSTYASIIETIQARGYVRQEHRRFFATDVGKTVTDLLVQWFPKIMDLKFTSHFEEELDEIETGKCHYQEVLDEFWGPFSDALKRAETDMPVQKGIETGEKCPDCGRPLIVLFSQKTGKQFVGCSGYKEDPACKYIKPGEGEEARPQPVLTDFDCPVCGKKMYKRVAKNGPFLGCSGYPECKGTMNLDAEGKPVPSAVATEHKCDKCGSPMVKREGRRGPFLGCSAYPKCKNIVDMDANGNPVRPIDPGVACDKCNSPMTVKKGPRGPFLACTAYPKCRNAKPLSAELKEKLKDVLPASAPAAPKKPMPDVPITQECPECGGAMRLQKSRFGGRYFLGCTKYPKCKGTAKLDKALEAKIAEAEAAMA
ncbi:MAG: type I DNA topoisomerase [Gemmataceae bacterium]